MLPLYGLFWVMPKTVVEFLCLEGGLDASWVLGKWDRILHVFDGPLSGRGTGITLRMSRSLRSIFLILLIYFFWKNEVYPGSVVFYRIPWRFFFETL